MSQTRFIWPLSDSAKTARARANERFDDMKLLELYLARVLMGQILVDQSRRRESIKRGGGLKQVSFEFAEGELEHLDTIGEQGLDIGAALDKLAKVDPKSHSVAIMKLFFSGQNLRIAEAEGMEKSEVDRLWRYARCFLKDEIRNEDSA